MRARRLCRRSRSSRRAGGSSNQSASSVRPPLTNCAETTRPVRSGLAVGLQRLVDHGEAVAHAQVAVEVDVAGEDVDQLRGDGVGDAGLVGGREQRGPDACRCRCAATAPAARSPRGGERPSARALHQAAELAVVDRPARAQAPGWPSVASPVTVRPARPAPGRASGSVRRKEAAAGSLTPRRPAGDSAVSLGARLRPEQAEAVCASSASPCSASGRAAPLQDLAHRQQRGVGPSEATANAPPPALSRAAISAVTWRGWWSSRALREDTSLSPRVNQVCFTLVLVCPWR